MEQELKIIDTHECEWANQYKGVEGEKREMPWLNKVNLTNPHA